MSDRVDTYEPLVQEVSATVRMGEHPNGTWVKALDYGAAIRRAEEAERDLRLCKGHDIVAKFRMLAAERDDLLDKLIAERTRRGALEAALAVEWAAASAASISDFWDRIDPCVVLERLVAVHQGDV